MKLSSVRPRATTVVAVGALVVALGGTSYAAAKISGSQIKKHSIAGNRLKNNTVTGKQIKESTLGTVKRAKTATTAGTALNAQRLGGAPASSFLGGNDVFRFSTTMTKGDADQTLGTFGPFTFSASCAADSTSTDGELLAHANADGWIDGNAVSSGDNVDFFGVDTATANAGDFIFVGGTDNAATAAVNGGVVVAVNTGGKDCRFFGTLINSAG